MGINIRAKGQNGEREVCDLLNGIIYRAMKALDYPEDECLQAFSSVQRNQNQSAVGGNDLTNTFGLSFEIKRQEQLSVNTWWKQCTEAAARNNEVPVLMYRQNGKKWRVRTMVWLQAPIRNPNIGFWRPAELDEDTFKDWFFFWVTEALKAGHKVRT